MQIEIKRPLEFFLEVLETDDHVPSMRVQIRIVVAQFLHTYRYEGSCWIECKEWDSFVRSLSVPTIEGAVLHSMSEEFKFLIHQSNGRSSINLDLAKSDVGTNRQVKLSFEAALDDDAFSNIRDEFVNFPIWWDPSR
ncbi:hypothetical protein [Achromobacter xylosoxidans]|jgi:hypothetical protein|uniref:hypothetical protein n=1 Tax=Achromobacter TaxID=222 RepID=UPI000FDAC01C|nr:hypothetical protein [Achromobacter xylosoxidans]QQE57834.1 hypothetical protein I6H41_02005 [Achromobacter xylosoxidans]QQV11583.1 hypothetical protein I6I48_17135 [Achromobacter xylosoxidans]UXL07431.1 hypothetical protein N4T34_12225 [Achromobacter xylosoxidans]